MKYTSTEIIKHLEENWESKAHILLSGYGPNEKLNDDFKIEYGPEKLEDIFEMLGLDYLDSNRESLIK